jgi:alpha-mannosidase
VFFVLQDSQGTSIPYQIVEEPEPYHMRILLPAVVPALGHVRYRIVADAASLVPHTENHITETESTIHIENQFYSLDISRGGITSLFDKELDKHLLPKESALALFEVFVLDSCGNGSGEFSEIQQANNIYGVESRKYWLGSGYTESAGKQNISWRIARNEGLNQCDGEVATIIKGEARFPHFVLQQEFTVHHQVKKISVKVGIEAWDGTMYKEIRINVPYQSKGSSITYEIPLGILSVGEDEVDSAVGTQFYVNDGKTVHYPTPCRKIHPREVQSWIGISHEAHSVFIGCSDTPSFDFDESRGVVQPILLASRHSCLSTGNPYHQRGSHEYSFTLTSMQGDKTSCIQKNSGSGYPISATASYNCKKRDGLPLQASALQVTGPIEISTIKKAEDTDDLVLRVFEQYGKQTQFSFALEGGITAYRKTDMLEYGGEFVSKKCIEDSVEPYTVQTYVMKR